jgi:hypothetical protein
MISSCGRLEIVALATDRGSGGKHYPLAQELEAGASVRLPPRETRPAGPMSSAAATNGFSPTA